MITAIPKKLGLCIERIDKYLDEDNSTWVDIFDQLVIYNTEKANVKNPSTGDEAAAKEVAQSAIKQELPELKQFMDDDADDYTATKFLIQIMYKKNSGPWHGNIIVKGEKGESTRYVTLNHWHKGIGLINVSNRLGLWGGLSATRCGGPVRAGISLKDVIIYGLKWWASVDVVFRGSHYSNQLWPASCHGLADTVAAHIAQDYSLCPTQQQWWKVNKPTKKPRSRDRVSTTRISTSSAATSQRSRDRAAANIERTAAAARAAREARTMEARTISSMRFSRKRRSRKKSVRKRSRRRSRKRSRGKSRRKSTRKRSVRKRSRRKSRSRSRRRGS